MAGREQQYNMQITDDPTSQIRLVLLHNFELGIADERPVVIIDISLLMYLAKFEINCIKRCQR
jgi:hypothetical protein